MEFLKFKGDFVPSFYWEYYVEVNQDFCQGIDKKVLDLMDDVYGCVDKVSVGKEYLEVRYLIPCIKNNEFLTKGFTQFLTTGLIKSIQIPIFNAEHTKLFSINIIPSELKCPDWTMDLQVNNNDLLALNVKYEINSLKID